MAKSGADSLLGPFAYSEIKSFISYIIRKTMVAQTPTGPVYLSSIREGRLNGRMIQIVANLSSFEQAKAHLVETMFYDEWALSSKSLVFKPQGTFVPRWEDVQDDPEPDLRKLLARKKKRKEAPAVEPDEMPQCLRVRGLDDRIVYKL